MKSTLRGSMLVLSVSLLATSCSPQQAPASVDTAATSANAASDSAPAATARIAEVKVGRYVDPKTYAVEGVDTSFKANDKLFASVRVEGLTAPGNVSAKLTDDQGKVLMEQNHEVAAKGAMRANFSLTGALAAPLASGHYRVDVQLDGGKATSTDITVE